MKFPSILLIDSSVTVQKVISLSLDKNRYQLHFSSTLEEAKQVVKNHDLDMVLVSDQTFQMEREHFPSQLRNWLGELRNKPPIILITSLDLSHSEGYQAILKKPFAPAHLTKLVELLIPRGERMSLQPRATPNEHPADRQLEQRFNQSFNNEAELVEKTFQESGFFDLRSQKQVENPSRTTSREAATMEDLRPKNTLWQPDREVAMSPPSRDEEEGLWERTQFFDTKTAQASSPQHAAPLAPKPTAFVEEHLSGESVEKAVERVLEKMVPPIVEKLVREQLELLLREQEQSASAI